MNFKLVSSCSKGQPPCEHKFFGQKYGRLKKKVVESLAGSEKVLLFAHKRNTGGNPSCSCKRPAITKCIYVYQVMPQLRNYNQKHAVPPIGGMYDRVMDYLHTIELSSEMKRDIANRLLEEALREDATAKMKEQFRLKKDLEHFSTFTDDWDGEGGKPLQKESIHNFEALLPLLSVRALRGINISPENNGTLLVTSKIREAGVNIGNHTYTYYSIENGQVEGESQLDYDAEHVLEQIENIVS